MTSGLFKSTAIFCSSLLIWSGQLQSQTIETWPMPCDQELSLTRVDTPTESNWLMDMEVKLGHSDSNSPVSDFVRTEPLVGALVQGNDPELRYYLIGTYELTEGQYNSIMHSRKCSSNQNRRKPISKVSWFDAIEFTRRYTEWLAEHRPDVLNENFFNQKVYVRLPTEAEWEFAARGGTWVANQEEFRAPLFPFSGSINDYVWVAGQHSCNGKVQQVGQKKANPLGLYDILGNVQEIVLDPFRLNAGGRLHGQAGGFITRGGSCSTPGEDITSAYRAEYDYFQDSPRIANKPAFTGFRVVVSATAHPLSRSFKLEEDFEALNNYLARNETDKKIQDLLATDLPESTKKTISEIAAEFNNEIVRRNRKEKRSAQSMIRAGALTIRQYRAGDNSVMRYQKACNLLKEESELTNKNFCSLYEQARAVQQTTRTIYSELVFQVAEDFALNELRAQKKLALAPISSSLNASKFVEIFLCHVGRYKREQSSQLDRYFYEIRTLDLNKCKDTT